MKMQNYFYSFKKRAKSKNCFYTVADSALVLFAALIELAVVRALCLCVGRGALASQNAAASENRKMSFHVALNFDAICGHRLRTPCCGCIPAPP